MPHYVYERKCLFFTINHIHAYIFFYKTPLRSRSENNSPPNKDLWPMHTNAILNSTICNIPLFSYNIFRPLFSFPLFFVGAACADVVVYLHCFSFRWIRYAHVQWPDIKFDGIFHRINALWDIANTHTQKTRTRFFFVCCCCFFLLCLCFANFPIFVRVWQDIRRKNYDKWELRSARNFQEELLKISKQSMIKSMNTNNTYNKL